MDGLIEQTHRVKVIWAWRFANPEFGLPREGLLVLFNLIAASDFVPVLHGAGMTHEMSVYEVDPSTPVDYGKSLFEQKSVSPLVPTSVGFQFRADSNDAAIERMGALVRQALDEDLPAHCASAWMPMFLDGVYVRREARVEAAPLCVNG